MILAFKDSLCLLSILFYCFSAFSEESVIDIVDPGDGEKTFVVDANVTSLEEFREIAIHAARLKPYGKVEINISTLADKGFHEIPEGRNFWHEYASYTPTPFKFFPDPKIAPFIPADFVKRNRDLLLGKVQILRKYDLGAAFWSYEPNFLPEEFFETHPHMRGPRIDHPRRSNHPAFAADFHVEETREMYKNMMAELVEHVPELNTFYFKTNDAGSGICWAEWLYTGPNGPIHCKDYSTGETVAIVMNTFSEGAARGGKDITLYMTGSMFTDDEMEDIYNNLQDQEGQFAQGQPNVNIKNIGSPFQKFYPVKGVFNPLDVLGRIGEPGKGETIFINFKASYGRDYEHHDIIEKTISVLEHELNSFAAKESRNKKDHAMYFCKKWAGDSADKLYDAFTKLQEAERSRDFGGRLSSRYWGVSTRHITRPLIVAPQRLSPEEEAYFLPHIFNVSEEEARMDFTDIHGSHRTASRDAVMDYISKIEVVTEIMEEVSTNAPEKEFIKNIVRALKMNNSILRSSGNFAKAQEIRDRNHEKLSATPHRPSKDVTWTGDPDIQEFNNIMRDELDNTQKLIDLLEDGGMDYTSHATNPVYEDTFVLGPDLIDQLKLKRKIMIRHWRDIEKYMTSPFK